MAIGPTSTVPRFLDKFRETLEAQPAFAKVEIATAALGHATKPESIQIFDVDGEQPWGALGAHRRDEEYAVQVAIWACKPGAGEPAIKAVRDRAYALFAAVEQVLLADPTLGGVVLKVRFGLMQLEQGANKGERWAQLSFTIHAQAILRPTG